ncbi:YfhO family protein [Candidatus Beckwithbacteria bacterium]|nr:YfhO family protein [Candidatus Beckwithbacteria bacterium]
MVAKTWVSTLLIIVFFLITTLWYFWPVVTHFDSYLPDNYDGLFITWSINRIAQNFPVWPGKLMEGNIFYPNPYTHAYSDLFITSGLLAKPLLVLWPESLVGYNWTLLVGHFLLLVFTFLFLDSLAENKCIAGVLALVFGYSQIHLHYLPHLQLFTIFLLPLSGWCLIKFAKNKKNWWLYGWFLSLSFQLINSILPGYFIVASFLVLYIYLPELRLQVKKSWKALVLGSSFTLLIAGPFLWIYFQVSKYFNYSRPLTEVIHFSLSPEQLLTKFFSPVLFGLFVVAMGVVIFTKKKPPYLVWIWASLGSLILALGPALHWQEQTVKIPFHIPLPYLLLYFIVPGFQSMRTPSRWVLLAGFFITVVLALFLQHVFAKKKTSLTIVLLSIIICAWMVMPRFDHYYQIPKTKQYPAVYSWLKNQPGQVVMELPMTAWGGSDQNKQEVYRMLYSLNHKKQLVNGYSGFFPPDYVTLVNVLQAEFPSQKTLKLIKDYQVDYLIVHQDEFRRMGESDIENKIEKTIALQADEKFENDLVYILRK